MSITDSRYGERWFELDRAIGNQIHMENAKRQYEEQKAEGEVEDMTFEQWYQAGNYDENDWPDNNP